MSRCRAVGTSLLLAALTATATFGDEARFETFRPVTTEEAAIRLLAPETASAARELAPTARCSESVRRSAEVELRWQSVGATAGAQRVDVTKFRDGFDLARYDVSPPLAPGRDSVALAGPEPGIHYYWRVLTETPRGWAPSRVERFEVPVCPWDPPRLDLLDGEGPTLDGPLDEAAEAAPPGGEGAGKGGAR